MHKTIRQWQLPDSYGLPNVVAFNAKIHMYTREPSTRIYARILTLTKYKYVFCARQSANQLVYVWLIFDGTAPTNENSKRTSKKCTN